MSRAKTDQRFAPLPLRALRDPRLGAQHLRVLGIIAAHDQLDKNGAGCWASQRRLAALARVHESRLSHLLSELRDYGYLASTIHATNRRRRIHRIVYDERDKSWDLGSRDTCSTAQASLPDTCAPEQVSEGRYLRKSEAILAKNGEKFDASENDSKDLAHRTYVPEREDISKPDSIDRTDCAQARNQSVVSEAEKYLTELEALAVSSDRDALKFERPRITQLANDACLPEELNERASRLLSQI